MTNIVLWFKSSTMRSKSQGTFAPIFVWIIARSKTTVRQWLPIKNYWQNRGKLAFFETSVNGNCVSISPSSRELNLQPWYFTNLDCVQLFQCADILIFLWVDYLLELMGELGKHCQIKSLEMAKFEVFKYFFFCSATSVIIWASLVSGSPRCSSCGL